MAEGRYTSFGTCFVDIYFLCSALQWEINAHALRCSYEIFARARGDEYDNDCVAGVGRGLPEGRASRARREEVPAQESAQLPPPDGLLHTAVSFALATWHEPTNTDTLEACAVVHSTVQQRRKLQHTCLVRSSSKVGA